MSAPRPVQSSRLIRRALSALAALTVVAVLAAAGWQGYRWALLQPVRHVAFAGAVERLPKRDLDALVAAVRSSDNPSLESVRQAARAVPWVRDAGVRRLWPDGVEITFETYEAVARWNDDRLVSERGEVFAADTTAPLPRLRGPENATATMVQELPALARTLAPLGSPLAELRLSRRGAWQALLASGLVIELGRGDIQPRAQRFAAAWPKLAAQGVATLHADLRYPNGFALRTAKTASPTLPHPNPPPKGERAIK
jgi:cell division protein FtsQ